MTTSTNGLSDDVYRNAWWRDYVAGPPCWGTACSEVKGCKGKVRGYEWGLSVLYFAMDLGSGAIAMNRDAIKLHGVQVVTLRLNINNDQRQKTAMAESMRTPTIRVYLRI